MTKPRKPLYSLTSLKDFKAVLSIDDREDHLCRHCLVTATYSIEQYCKRRLLRRKHTERLECTGDSFFPLREYPVISISNEQLAMSNEQGAMSNEKISNSLIFRVIPELGADIDIPFSIELSPVVKKIRGLKYIQVEYRAGYAAGKVPPDLASACLELAAWNMGRYRGRRIGMTGNVRGSGRDGEHFELSMPKQVRDLLEPYKRKTI